MPKTVDFLFDCGAPNAYLAHKILPSISERTNITFNYVPVLLGGIFKATGNLPPMMRYKDAPAKLAYENLEFKRFMEAHNISGFQFNPNFPINSITSMRAAIAAQNAGQLMAFVDAAMAAFWEQGKNMGDANIIAEVLNDAGLDGDALIAATQDQVVKDALAANTQKAIDRGTFGVPTFFVGGLDANGSDSDIFWGKERLDQVVAAALE